MNSLSELHPLFVHFPIAIFVLYGILELIGILMNRQSYSKIAHLLLFIGVITAVGASLTGNLAKQSADLILSIKNDSNITAAITKHEEYATYTLWYFLFVLILRTYLILKKKYYSKLRYIFIILVVIGLYFIIQTGNMGGRLVYKYGVGTEFFK